MKKIALFPRNLIMDLEEEVNDFVRKIEDKGAKNIQFQMSSVEGRIVIMVTWEEE